MSHRQCAQYYPGNLPEQKATRLGCQDDAADGRLEKEVTRKSPRASSASTPLVGRLMALLARVAHEDWLLTRHRHHLVEYCRLLSLGEDATLAIEEIARVFAEREVERRADVAGPGPAYVGCVASAAATPDIRGGGDANARARTRSRGDARGVARARVRAPRTPATAQTRVGRERHSSF